MGACSCARQSVAQGRSTPIRIGATVIFEGPLVLNLKPSWTRRRCCVRQTGDLRSIEVRGRRPAHNEGDGEVELEVGSWEIGS